MVFSEIKPSEGRKKYYKSFSLDVPDFLKAYQVKLIVTLSYFSKINHSNQAKYRQEKLEFNVTGIEHLTPAFNTHQIRRGTVQHQVYNKIKFQDDKINIEVTSKAETETSFALAITLESEERLKENLYEYIREKIEEKISEEIHVD